MSNVVTNENGEVAVLVSHGYGAGWYSWNTSIPECLFEPRIVHALMAEDRKEAEKIATELWPDGYWGGIRGLTVHWLSPGTAFRIDEYDGSESLVEADRQDWVTVPTP